MTSLQSLHNLYPMNITSLMFVYVYLPVSLLVYYVMPRRARPAVLLVVSIGFCALSQPEHLLLMVTSLVLDFTLTQGIVTLKRPFWRRVFLFACIIKNLFLIGYFGVTAELRFEMIPFGLFVYCMSGIDGVYEAYKEENPTARAFIPYALYISFFPRLYAGPLLPPGGFIERCRKAEFDARSVMQGFGRFAEGLLKYVVIGRSLYLFHYSVKLIPQADESVLSAWLLLISFALALYFTMSGLADIARGIAGLFGISLPQNYYYPYQSRSVTDFFDRFNITVGGFLKRTILAALHSDKDDPIGDSLNLLLAGMLWGLWFGIRANHAVWGAFVALFMVMEKYLYPKALKNIPTLFCRGYALCVTLAGFTVLSCETIGESVGQLSRMFGAGQTPLFNDRVLYVLVSNRLLILIAVLLSTNLINLFVNFLRKSYPRISAAVFGAADVVILAVFTSVILGGAAI